MSSGLDLGAPLASEKQHFLFLDGMRGIAALAVVWLHAAHVFGIETRPVHAGLAVDFFFCLSGFVVAYAYDARIMTTMGMGEFMKKRMIRLYPMIFFGVLLGLVASLAALQAGQTPGQVVALAAAGLALIPLGLAFGQTAYPINSPMWSLFFEIFASWAYWVGTRLFSRRVLAWSMAPIGLVLLGAIVYAGEIGSIGFIGLGSFLAGFFRVGFPFLAGVMIYRFGLHGRLPVLPDVVIAALLCAVLLATVWDGSTAYDILGAMIVLPAIVAFGATARVTPILAGLWSFIGRLFYPVYLVHQPTLRLVKHLAETYAPDLPRVLVVPAAALIAVALSYAVLLAFDEPVRRFLSRPAARAQRA